MAQLYDVSKTKATIFVSKKDLLKILSNKYTLMVEGKQDFRIEKVYNIADSEFVSNYKVEIIGDKQKVFSK